MFHDLFETCVEPALNQVFGGGVTFRRGTVELTGLSATWSDQSYSINDSEGVPSIIKSRDYVLAKSLIVIHGETSEPRSGDWIIDAGQTFEVTPIGELPAFSEMPGGYRWLLHTKVA